MWFAVGIAVVSIVLTVVAMLAKPAMKKAKWQE